MTSQERVVIDGYDLLAESSRLALPDRVLCGRAINRGTASVPAQGLLHPPYDSVRAGHHREVMPSTLDPEGPVIDLSWPTAGHFVSSPAGTYLDLYQGVAQKLVDDQHPAFRRTIESLVTHGLAFRREINTDDYETLGTPLDGLHTPQELAGLINRLTQQALQGMGRVQCFFSNSGAESGEASIKLAQLHAYRRFLRRHGPTALFAVMDQLGIARDPFFDVDRSLDDPVFVDYPFFVIGCDNAFHGRTLGVLNLTRSKKAHQLGYSKLRWIKHIPFNGRPEDLSELLDVRPIEQVLQAPGGLRAVIDAGRVPVDLAAMFCCEVYQGEGGYVLADRTWIHGIASICRRHDILLGLDEVQSFGRTGLLYACGHFDLTPDLLWTAKAAVLGVTVARATIVEDCHPGWHSNTFGSGKFFDVNMAWSTWHLLTGHNEPLFEGRTLLENSRIKGEYMRLRLAELSAAHPELFPEFSGLGGMWGLTVRMRAEVISTAWRMGLKLLGCGRPGDFSRIRIVLLADVLTREIDEVAAGLERVFSAVEQAHPDEY